MLLDILYKKSIIRIAKLLERLQLEDAVKKDLDKIRNKQEKILDRLEEILSIIKPQE